jgi:hypothetical protein
MIWLLKTLKYKSDEYRADDWHKPGMILYGEDRITPAKSGDGAGWADYHALSKTLWHLVFGNDADDCYQDLLYLKVGPFIRIR